MGGQSAAFDLRLHHRGEKRRFALVERHEPQEGIQGRSDIFRVSDDPPSGPVSGVVYGFVQGWDERHRPGSDDVDVDAILAHLAGERLAEHDRAGLGGDVTPFVHEKVVAALRRRLR